MLRCRFFSRSYCMQNDVLDCTGEGILFNLSWVRGVRYCILNNVMALSIQKSRTFQVFSLVKQLNIVHSISFLVWKVYLLRIGSPGSRLQARTLTESEKYRQLLARAGRLRAPIHSPGKFQDTEKAVNLLISWSMLQYCNFLILWMTLKNYFLRIGKRCSWLRLRQIDHLCVEKLWNSLL